MGNQRESWADSYKAVAIFFVVLGHRVLINHEIVTWIYSFHMPMFFFISGVFFNPKGSFIDYAQNKVKSLLMPYIVFAPMLFLFWYFIGRNYGESVNGNYSVNLNLLGIIYSQYNEWMQWGIQMWFLPCLFITSLLYYYLHYRFKKRILLLIIIILGFLGFLYGNYSTIRLPWSIDVAFISLFFFGLGHSCKTYILRINYNRLASVFLSGILLVLSFYLANMNGRVDLFGMSFQNSFIYIFNALLGITTFVLISKLIPGNKVFSFIGQNTLVIFVFHKIAGSVISAFYVFILNIDLIPDTTLKAVLLSLIQILMMYPIIIIWSRIEVKFIR